MGEMRRRQKWKRNVFAGLIYFALLTGIIVVKEGARVYPGGGEVEILKDGWMWVQSDGTEVPVEVRDRVKIGKGEPLIIKNQIPEEGGHGMSLSFWSTMESVRVWADGELLYEYGTDTDVDRIWNHVYIPEDKAGKELIIEKICPYSIYAGQIRPVIWGYYPEIQYFLMNRYYPDYIIGQLLILFGVFLIAASLLMKSRHFPLKRGLYLGLFYTSHISMDMLRNQNPRRLLGHQFDEAVVYHIDDCTDCLSAFHPRADRRKYQERLPYRPVHSLYKCGGGNSGHIAWTGRHSGHALPDSYRDISDSRIYRLFLG